MANKPKKLLMRDSPIRVDHAVITDDQVAERLLYCKTCNAPCISCTYDANQLRRVLDYLKE